MLLPFKKNLLALPMMLALSPMANAASDEEVAALRKEVAELKSMIQQQMTQKPTAQPVQQSAPPIGFISQDNAVKNGFGGLLTVQTQPQNLSVMNANGSEVELYGILRGDASYVIEGTDSYSNNIPNVGTTPVVKNKTQATANASRIGFAFKSNVGADNKLAAKLEADFINGVNNSDGSLRVRHAFITYNDWLIGQTKSNFLGYSPEILDTGTNVGTGFKRVPMVRYNYNFKPDTQLLVSLERGQSASDVAKDVSTQYKLPVLTARLNQSFANKKGLVTLRGMAENYDVVRNTKNNSDKDSNTGWGIGTGINYKVNDVVELFGDIGHTKGTSGLLYGATNAFAKDNNGNVDQNTANTFMIGSVLKINPKLRSNIGYGQISFDDDNDYARLVKGKNISAADERLRSIWANLVYSPLKPLDLGIEYHDGDRKLFSGEKYHDKRVGLMAAYKF